MACGIHDNDNINIIISQGETCASLYRDLRTDTAIQLLNI